MSNYQYEQELNIHWLLSGIQTFFPDLAVLVTNNNERNATRECKAVFTFSRCVPFRRSATHQRLRL